MHRQDITTISIQTHEKSLTIQYLHGGVADAAFRGKNECQDLDLSTLRPDLCPFHPFYAIQLVPFKNFI